MTLHQTIQRILLLGTRLPLLPPAPQPRPPQQLEALVESIAADHRACDARAVHYGHRYRSGFWAIYLLSAIAVLCAIIPLALGWDDRGHALHPLAGLWAAAEVGVIAIVSAIYWIGDRGDWQGEWLRQRTTAELAWYLPLLAPLVDFEHPASQPNWYARVFDPDQSLHSTDEVATICSRNEALARKSTAHAWHDRAFITSYAQWTIDILEAQRRYHHGVALKQHALQHRVHALNTWLFALTALGATFHLLLHTLWLTLVTTFFPALGASLHGALAQSEAYRLGATSERLVRDLQMTIDRIRATLEQSAAPAASVAAAVKQSIEDALALILEEHQDWQMLVRPHHLPLA
jgi:hypothetical protein